MSRNPSLVEVKDRGWLNGFRTLWGKENHSWWGTMSWLVKIFIWMAVIDGLLAIVVFSTPKIDPVEADQATIQAETGEVGKPLDQTALMTYFLIAAMLPTFGVIILGQDAVIQERQTGTAAWVLSKPVSRSSFLLSKLFAHALGVLATMVLVQGLVAYFLYKSATAISLHFTGFLAGMGLIYLFLISVLALILMLGTLFHSRGPLLGISMAFVSGNILIGLALPGLGKAMPCYMFWDLGSGLPSLAEALAMGQPIPTVIPIIVTVLMTTLFIIVALVRFEREEF